MSGRDADSRSRLCPDHRGESVPSQSCTKCAQARRIDELEQAVERLTEHVEELKSDDEDTTEKTTQIAIAEADSP